jgi:hypothetical protein
VRLATIISAVAIALSGCGGDDDSEAPPRDPRLDDAAAVYAEIRDLTDKQQIERVGGAWAHFFSGGDEAMCEYLHPDVADRCSDYLQSGLTGSHRLQRSYAGTSVAKAEINGRTAVAEFSNGERVAFEKDPEDRWMVVRTSRAE